MIRTTSRGLGAGCGALAMLLLAGCGGGGKGAAPGVETTRGPVDVRSREALTAEMELARTQAALSPEEAFWPYYEGSLQAAAGETGEAEAALRRSLAVDLNYVPALALLTRIHYETGRHDEAIELLEEARDRVGPSALSPELREGLALHYDAVGDLEGAASLLSEIEAAGPRSLSVPTFVILRGNDFHAAGETARRAVDADGTSAVHRNNLGITLLHDGDPAKAREAFYRAVELDPMLPGPLYNLALVEKFYFMDDDAAQMWWRRYRDLSPGEDPDNLAEVFDAPAEEVSSAQEGN